MEGKIEYIGPKDSAFEKFENEVMEKHPVEIVNAMPTRVIKASSFEYEGTNLLMG
jgi:hypothetical protein